MLIRKQSFHNCYEKNVRNLIQRKGGYAAQEIGEAYSAKPYNHLLLLQLQLIKPS